MQTLKNRSIKSNIDPFPSQNSATIYTLSRFGYWIDFKEEFSSLKWICACKHIIHGAEYFRSYNSKQDPSHSMPLYAPTNLNRYYTRSPNRALPKVSIIESAGIKQVCGNTINVQEGTDSSC